MIPTEMERQSGFRIDAIRHRFEDAGEALEAARTWESHTLQDLDYQVKYSVGDETEGWSVEVHLSSAFSHGSERAYLGNLVPLEG